MKSKIIFASLVLFTGLAATSAAQAEGKIYVGAKLGTADSDIPGFYSDALTAGVYGGYNLLGKDAQFAANLGGGSLAVEGALDTTTVKGKVLGSGKWDINSLGIYAAYRFPIANSFYLKGKAGVVHYDINSVVAPGTGTTDTLAVGVGGGYKFGPGSIELEITTYSADVLTATAGFHMSF